MTDLQEGHTALMSFQQAIGGSLSRSERVQDVDDEDDDPLPVSRSGSTDSSSDTAPFPSTFPPVFPSVKFCHSQND